MAIQPIPGWREPDIQLKVGRGTIRWHKALGFPKRPFVDNFSIFLAMKQEVWDDLIPGFRVLWAPQAMYSVTEAAPEEAEYGVDFVTRILTTGTEYRLTAAFSDALDWPRPVGPGMPNPALLAPRIEQGIQGFTMGEAVHQFRPIRVASRMFP
jgi:hypothetical protein